MFPINDILYQNWTNSFAPLNKSAARAADKKYLQTKSSPEPLVQEKSLVTSPEQAPR